MIVRLLAAEPKNTREAVRKVLSIALYLAVPAAFTLVTLPYVLPYILPAS